MRSKIRLCHRLNKLTFFYYHSMRKNPKYILRLLMFLVLLLFFWIFSVRSVVAHDLGKYFSDSKEDFLFLIIFAQIDLTADNYSNFYFLWDPLLHFVFWRILCSLLISFSGSFLFQEWNRWSPQVTFRHKCSLNDYIKKCLVYFADIGYKRSSSIKEEFPPRSTCFRL